MPADSEIVDVVRRVRRRLVVHGPESVRTDGDFERVSLPAGDCDVLRDVLVAEKPRVTIEIGLAYGSSALAIAEALISSQVDGTEHVIVDAFQDQLHDAGWKALVAAGIADRCTLLRERSQLALPRLVASGFTADAAFVDGSHTFHNVFVDLHYLRELVRPGGLLILDDCQFPSVATAVRYFELNTGWQPEPIDRDTRLRAYRLPNPPIEPSIEDFEPFYLD